MIEFNINNNVRVKLTDAGRAIVRADREETNAAIRNNGGTSEMPLTVKEDEHGWSTWQLWSLMQTFGPHVGLGCVMPFDAVIQIP